MFLIVYFFIPFFPTSNFLIYFIFCIHISPYLCFNLPIFSLILYYLLLRISYFPIFPTYSFAFTRIFSFFVYFKIFLYLILLSYFPPFCFLSFIHLQFFFIRCSFLIFFPILLSFPYPFSFFLSQLFLNHIFPHSAFFPLSIFNFSFYIVLSSYFSPFFLQFIHFHFFYLSLSFLRIFPHSTFFPLSIFIFPISLSSLYPSSLSLSPLSFPHLNLLRCPSFASEKERIEPVRRNTVLLATSANLSHADL